jgi:hypothetical protein
MQSLIAITRCQLRTISIKYNFTDPHFASRYIDTAASENVARVRSPARSAATVGPKQSET